MRTRYDCTCRYFKVNQFGKDVCRTEELQYFSKLCPTIAALKWKTNAGEYVYYIII